MNYTNDLVNLDSSSSYTTDWCDGWWLLAGDWDNGTDGGLIQRRRTMRTPLDGYKTYIVGAVIIGTAVFFYLRGEIDAPSAITMILGALGMGALRHGQTTGK